MPTSEQDMAAGELARAARLEHMANALMIEAREIRSRYQAPRKRRGPVNMVALGKSIVERRR